VHKKSYPGEKKGAEMGKREVGNTIQPSNGQDYTRRYRAACDREQRVAIAAERRDKRGQGTLKRNPIVVGFYIGDKEGKKISMTKN